MKSPSPLPRRGRPRCFNEDEALDRAMRVFWKKGYLGTSLTDLTEAMGVNRPSLYATFGNKEALYRKVLERYSQGPTAYLCQALQQPTAKEVAAYCLTGAVELLACPQNSGTCLWVHGAFSCGGPGDPLAAEFTEHRAQAQAELRKRFERAKAEADLPTEAEPALLAGYVQTIMFGLAVMASTGAAKEELQKIAETALEAWPEAGSGKGRGKR